MIELLILGLLTVLWMRPDWSLLNRGGVLLFLLMAPGLALAWRFAPVLAPSVLIWWTACLAIFLTAGSAVIIWRGKEIRTSGAPARRSVGDWAPIVRVAGMRLVRKLLPAIVVGIVVFTAASLFGRATLQSALIGTVVFFATPFVLFAYLWFATKVADTLAR